MCDRRSFSASRHYISSFKNYALKDGNVQRRCKESKKWFIWILTFVAIPTFHENRGKGDYNHGDDSGDEFDVHDNADFWNLSTLHNDPAVN